MLGCSPVLEINLVISPHLNYIGRMCLVVHRRKFGRLKRLRFQFCAQISDKINSYFTVLADKTCLIQEPEGLVNLIYYILILMFRHTLKYIFGQKHLVHFCNTCRFPYVLFLDPARNPGSSWLFLVSWQSCLCCTEILRNVDDPVQFSPARLQNTPTLLEISVQEALCCQIK